MRKTTLIIFLITLITWSVSAQFEQVANGITDNKIIVDGKEFYLYKVKEKEGFYSLERKFGVSRVEIVEHNPEVAQGLKLGQIIKIPVLQGRNSTQSELAESGDFIFHSVEKGQTMFFISRKYGIPEEEIFKHNPQSREILIAGTQLKIPVKKVEEHSQKRDEAFIYHQLKPGETLSFVARKYNKPLKSVLDANPGMQSEEIPIGSLIRVPQETPGLKPVLETKVVNADTVAYVFEDETYFYHKIEPKQTFYSIINQYNVEKDAVLHANNISDPTNLKIGYIIKIPKHAVKPMRESREELQDGKHLIYRVKDKRESYDDIAAKFSVSVEELKEANPGFRLWGRFKEDELVKIPMENLFKQPVVKEETKTRKPQKNLQYISDSLILSEAFSLGCDTMMHEKPLNVAVLWPFFLDANDTVNIVREVTEEGDTIVSQKDPLEVFDMSDRQGFREFYAGIIVAIDSLKRKGFDINLYTYDTSNDTVKVKSILARPELRLMDLIIGPAYTHNVNFVARFCLQHRIKMVVPYSSALNLTLNNPYVFQVNPFLGTLFNPSIDYITSNFKSSNIIVVNGGKTSKSTEDFTERLKRQLYRSGLNQYQPVSFKEVDVVKYGFQGLEKVIDPVKHNLIVMPPEPGKTDRRELFGLIVPTIENMVKKKRMKNITLFAYPDYQGFTGRELRMVFESNTILYTPFYVDFEADNTTPVLQLFRDHFNMDPTADYPYFGLLGFDIAYYFLNALHEFGPDFDRCLPYLTLDLTTSGFNFQRVNNWSGMVNTNISFLNFKRNYEVVKLDYKPVVKPLEKLELTNIEF